MIQRVLSRLPGVGGWESDPLWARFYDWTVENPTAGVPLWRLGLNSDLRLLYAATAEVGRQPTGARVLDVPCGGGVGLRGLRPGQGVEYVAADISASMLARTERVAQQRGVADQVQARVADAQALPFATGSFDLVLSLTGLHCFTDPETAVAELARVLKPGAVITGSALLDDTGWAYEHIRRGGRALGVVGRGCTSRELVRWLAANRVADVVLRPSGGIVYFRGTRR
ncbi:methyltransferase domain-containing protein [Nocardioides sp. zg-536]|uniref:Methyltransferase domain-containing protein n=1 Tax=Nocardioides faecalis TaxID=2803858 RepID=A0A938Y6M3_9ACTN|nr:class I SAM-dependent methyltransferase [Nocardioides faecalis]MBM9461028.1 methyltransferase domain-containing protein [Nocardioides faecalis]MBS4752066.1 methyltransferase domain-containing protein [Nocardioides faecalis]QVI59117.1 methyltransferase domain-containing protein [Nocardioides faecalis]